jgi:hypothetical protein
MPKWREPRSLEQELASFGVRAQHLSAAHLVEYPEILEVLFGSEAVADPDARQLAADRVEAALLAMLADTIDPIDRRVGEAFLAAHEDFYGKKVSDRLNILVGERITLKLYKVRRKLIVREALVRLRALVADDVAVRPHPVLSSEARHAAEQLFRYAKQTLLLFEEYDFCSRLPWRLPDTNEYMQGTLNTEVTRDHDTDRCLWAFVHCQSYLRILQRDRASRDYLRENLPMGWWHTQLRIPFSDRDMASLEAIVPLIDLDEPKAFVEKLLESEPGRELYECWWLDFLGGRPSRSLRPSGLDASHPTSLNRLRIRLVVLCELLEEIFPGDRMPPAAAIASFVWDVQGMLNGRMLSRIRLAGDDGVDAQEVRDLWRRAREERPTRHIFGEQEDVSMEW